MVSIFISLPSSSDEWPKIVAKFENRIWMLDVRNNVGRVWDKSGLRQGIEDETIKLPEKDLLSENHCNLPYFFLGDDSLL